MMQGLMQHHPLLISGLLTHAAREHGKVEIVSRTVEGPIHRTTWAGIAERAARVAHALRRLGVEPGERVATLAWNGYRHLELFFGVSGAGIVLHTANPRLFPEQIEYMLTHAEDRVLFFDVTFAPLVASLATRLTHVHTYVALCAREDLPDAPIPNLVAYEDLLAPESPSIDWPALDETAASSLCYTSGTTGHPKGVLYSHRSTLLHAMSCGMVDGMGVSALESILVCTPMFHVNGWGTPYTAAMTGAKLVLPGAHLDGASLYSLLRAEAVTLTLGVPTVWLGLMAYVAREGLKPRDELRLRRVLVGGSAAPPALVLEFERVFGARVLHAWGMTETSPLGTTCTPRAEHDGADLEARVALQASQGRPPYGVEFRITADDGRVLPRDGASPGHLLIRGHWVAAAYFGRDAGPILDADGFFDTGDIATISDNGYLYITDRAKDVIKSGGEWISSIDLENAALGHPGVAEAAAIGVHHPTWQERPLLVVVAKPGAALTAEALTSYLAGRVAKWWLPDAIEFVAELPHTATGKLQKMKLREQFRDYRLPGT